MNNKNIETKPETKKAEGWHWVRWEGEDWKIKEVDYLGVILLGPYCPQRWGPFLGTSPGDTTADRQRADRAEATLAKIKAARDKRIKEQNEEQPPPSPPYEPDPEPKSFWDSIVNFLT